MTLIRTVILGGVMLLLIALLLCVMALPAIIAIQRRHPHKWVILALTIVGGWTIILWLAALFWALTGGQPRSSQAVVIEHGDEDTGRKLGKGLIAGIVVMPLLFSWRTLRPGYGRTTRILSIGYAAIHTALLVAGLYAVISMIAEADAQGAVARIDAQRALAGNRYMVTTVDDVLAGIGDGRSAEYRQRIVVLDGSIVRSQAFQNGAEVIVEGPAGGQMRMRSTKGVRHSAWPIGSRVEGVCVDLFHSGPLVRFARCDFGRPGEFRPPEGADVEYRGGRVGKAVATKAAAPNSSQAASISATPSLDGEVTDWSQAEAVSLKTRDHSASEERTGPGGVVDNPFTR